MAELLNFYVDNLLKGTVKLSEQQLDETLEAIVRLFSYVDDKDVFYLAYRRSLSKRLLSRKFKEADEMNFISKLKIHSPDAAATQKLEGMFNDIKVFFPLSLHSLISHSLILSWKLGVNRKTGRI